LLHHFFGSHTSRHLRLPRVFICLFSNLVCTVYTPLAIFRSPMVSPCNVRFLYYKPDFVQKMTRHFFWVVSVCKWWCAIPAKFKLRRRSTPPPNGRKGLVPQDSGTSAVSFAEKFAGVDIPHVLFFSDFCKLFLMLLSVTLFGYIGWVYSHPPRYLKI